MKNSKGNKNYDVRFDDDTTSNNKGFAETYEYCKNWIVCNRNDSYFKDYNRGGTVSIIDSYTGEVLYSEEIN